MKIICKNCGNICADLKSKITIEQYVQGEFGATCEYCGEDNYHKENNYYYEENK